MEQAIGWLLAMVIRYAFYPLEALALLAIGWSGRFRCPAWAGPLRRFASGKRAVVVPGLAVLVLRAALLPLVPIRQPNITDEFSYLLAGDTFASGRLANPPHPMWRHFETMHVLMVPTYASMYPPAQGMILAAGMLFAKNAWIGVWISVAVMCALMCWMLQGWLPPGWAFLGGMLAVMRLGLLSYWMNSYWGGAAAAIGGLLVLGALARMLRRRARAWHGIAMAAGLVILANSRPYEGCVLGLAVIAILIAHRRLRWRVVLPMAAVLAAGAVGMCSYNRAVTGNPFRIPQLAAREAYAAAPYFFWQAERPVPVYRNGAMKSFYVGWELGRFREAKTIRGFLRNAFGKLASFWLFFLGPALTLPLMFLPRIAHDRRIRPLWIASGAGLIGLALNVFFYPHYAAPWVGAIYAVVLQGMRHLRVWIWKGRPIGMTLACSIPLVTAGVVLLRLALPGIGGLPPEWPMAWYNTRPGNLDRARIQAQLDLEPGRQLAMVRYRSSHNSFEEWVYNAADIDASRVVWARELGSGTDEELFRYFRSRRVWLVEPDAATPRVSPYSAPPVSGTAWNQGSVPALKREPSAAP